MKSTLSFDLPEEEAEFTHAVNGSKYSALVWEFDEWLRAEIKYKENSVDRHTALQQVRDMLWELAGDLNVKGTIT